MNIDDFGTYIPTPEQIAEECAKIRAGWKDGKDSSRERPRKRVGVIAEIAYPSSVEIDTDDLI